MNSTSFGDKELLEKWKNAVKGHINKTLTDKDKICEKHFNESEISRNLVNITNSYNSYNCKKYPTLKQQAAPSIFSKPLLSTKRKKKAKKYTEASKKRKSEIIEEENIEAETNIEFNFSSLMASLNEIKMPSERWGLTSHKDFVIAARWNEKYVPSKRIIFNNKFEISVYLYDYQLDDVFNVNSLEDVAKLIYDIENYAICAGYQNRKQDCEVFLGKENVSNPGRTKIYCKVCSKDRKTQKSNVTKMAKKCLAKSKLYQRIARAKKQNATLKKKVISLQGKVDILKKKFVIAEKEALSNLLNKLPQQQQESVNACLKAAENMGSGIRYTTPWIYECLLMRIKSRKLYEHLRLHKILALPSITTLNKYIRKFKGTFGFQDSIFICLKKKASSMDPTDRRGVLLIDEMSISPSLSFDKNSLKVTGLVDLGEHTPLKQKTEKGDHALVFMFQPFKGKWIQALACFISKGAASGSILHLLITECIILIEKSEFFIDAVVTDGAKWNRNMWAQFGITSEKVSCDHICSNDRKLWFISDWPHLVKNVRNAVVNKRILQTPDGFVKLNYWETVVEIDNPSNYTLKICPKLTRDHVNPKFYQKMNVGMAFQFFSDSAASAMDVLKEDYPALKDSDGCIKFIRRFNNVIDIMNSRTPVTALKFESKEYESVKEFLSFIENWEKLAKENNGNFISSTTCLGLKVTLKATLELSEFLTEKCKFQYLMTARLNQDSLEKYFGIMRNACGSNDHPDAAMFLQVFRLIGTYSLIKPPKGNNTSNSEILTSLMSVQDLEDPKIDFLQKVDHILDNGYPVQDLPNILNQNYSKQATELLDHNYTIINTSSYVIAYISGYIARKAKRFTTCLTCQNSVEEIHSEKHEHRLIVIKDRGGLVKPSSEIFILINLIEDAFLHILSNRKISAYFLNDILEYIETSVKLPFIGCINHQQELTSKIVQFYIITRMHFVCHRANLIGREKNKKAKEFRKLSKL